MRTQKEILEDETLSGYGMSATWYVMPEAEFTMKLELGVAKEENLEVNLDGKVVMNSKTKVVAALSNATYNSLYNLHSKQESTLRVKFVPVPMPAVVIVPEVTGLSLTAARKALSSVNTVYMGRDGTAWMSNSGLVVSQSVKGGDVMLADRTLIVTVEEGDEADGSKE